jgi:hypothetical protein
MAKSKKTKQTKIIINFHENIVYIVVKLSFFFFHKRQNGKITRKKSYYTNNKWVEFVMWQQLGCLLSSAFEINLTLQSQKQKKIFWLYLQMFQTNSTEIALKCMDHQNTWLSSSQKDKFYVFFYLYHGFFRFLYRYTKYIMII